MFTLRHGGRHADPIPLSQSRLSATVSAMIAVLALVLSTLVGAQGAAAQGATLAEGDGQIQGRITGADNGAGIEGVYLSFAPVPNDDVYHDT